MKTQISGFTIVRNAILMNYPVVESIVSVLPLVDEMVVSVGQSDDETRALIASIDSPKIRIVDSVWDISSTEGGRILSEKTNEALRLCKNDWCLYIQADEVLHEFEFSEIRYQLTQHANKPGLEGFHFKYIHFYGSFHTIATSRKWYREEVRLVRRSSGVQSVGDAQGFRIEGRKLFTLPSTARVFHYGWAKSPGAMEVKCRLFHYWWFGRALDRKFDNFNFSKIYGLKLFKGDHPNCMKERVMNQNWSFDCRRSAKDVHLADIRLLLSDLLEKATGWRPFERRTHLSLRRSSLSNWQAHGKHSPST